MNGRMKYFLLTIGLFLASTLFVQSQTLYGTTFYGGSNKGGTLDQLIVGTNNLTIAKSFETFARNPQFTSLVQASDGKLYGMTSEGGVFNAGIIFSYDPNSSTFSKLKDFDVANGGYPYGSLIQAADGNLYGMTTYGGNDDRGVIFSFNPGSAIYQKLMDFDSANGSNPSGALLEANQGKLYGITGVGGSHNAGVLFSYDITLSSYSKLEDFDSAGGYYPSGTLVQAMDGKLYGTTTMGGTTNNGVIFSFDTLSSDYESLYNFDLLNGASPTGNLSQAGDGNLYGMTATGGSNGYGVIFSYDPNNLNYTKLADFDGINGAAASGGLVQADDGKLYGMTWGGGLDFVQAGVIFSFDPSSMTYSMVHSFYYPNGGRPFGSLLRASDGKLYGLASNEGLGYNSGLESGVIFSFDPTTNTYATLKHLGSNEDGSNASAALTRGKDGKLYGQTTFGGSNSAGVIFTYNPSNSTYAKVKDLDYDGGSHPYGSLVQASDGKFYGMTAYGGVSTDPEYLVRWGDLGVIFSFDPVSSTYSNLVDFTTNGGYLGGHPYGSLVQADDGKLYGMTSYNGRGYRASGSGILFSFDPDLSTYSVLKDFSNFDPGGNFLDDLNGGNPYGSLLKASDGKLYGLTSGGGINSAGVIFSYEPGSDTYTKLVDLNDANGSHPYGTLIQASDDKLYGMTYDGGSNNAGVIFSFNVLTSTYTKLVDLNDNDGSNPYGSLMQANDGKLYGMTSGGGANDLGAIFSFDPATSSYTKLLDYDGANGSTPYIGSAFIELDLPPLPITLINFSGQNKENINELSWEIATDPDLNYFELQRSTDGRNFSDISHINNAGNLNYTFDDNISADTSSLYFYRLKIVDLDGNFKYSDVIKLSVNLKGDYIVANPNPFKDVLLLTVHSRIKDKASIVLTDLTGRQLFTKNESLSRGSNVIQINDSGRLPKGTYILTIATSGKKESIKVLKSN